jgi:hypothetical protein
MTSSCNKKLLVHGALSIGIVTFACQLRASTQIEEKTDRESRRMSTYASCYEESTGKLSGSHKSRTPGLFSPDGRYRAYAESEAVASPNAGSEECQNTSKLFVAGPKSEDFHAVLLIKPIRERHGNSIDLVDWSPAGHRLLLMEGAWEWGSDLFGSITRIYDADSETSSSDSVIDRGFLKTMGRHCVAILRPAGFTKEGLWLVDTAKSTARSLPDDYKVQHYGKESPGTGQ